MKCGPIIKPKSSDADVGWRRPGRAILAVVEASLLGCCMRVGTNRLPMLGFSMKLLPDAAACRCCCCVSICRTPKHKRQAGFFRAAGFAGKAPFTSLDQIP